MPSSELALGIVFGAVAKNSFQRVFGGARKSVTKLGAAVKATQAQLQDVGAYKKTDAALTSARSKFRAAQQEVVRLHQALEKKPGSVTLAKRLKAARRAASKLGDAVTQESDTLRKQSAALRRAGIDTRQLAEHEQRLTHTLTSQQAVLGATTERLHRRANAMHSFRGELVKLGGTLVAAHALTGWTKEAAAFNAEMQNIGNTADMTAGQIGSLRQAIFAASQQTGRGIGDVQAGIGFLVAAGLDVGRAQKSIVAIGRTATAEAANIEDLSKASFTLIDSMGIQPKGLATALDILTQAGKEGNVELRDMAQQLPGLGAMFNAMHMQGTKSVATLGAALEIARKGAADPSEAANNMRNYIKALFSPTTLAKAKQFGLDITQVMADAQKAGGNPFEASIQAVMKVTGGNATKLGQIFQDAQAQAFLRPMMQNWGEYQRIRNKALASHGVVDRDFAAQTGTTAQQLARMGNAWESFKANVGSALGGVAASLSRILTPVLNTIGKLAGKFPQLTTAVLAAAGAFLTFNTAVAGFKLLRTFLPSIGSFSGAMSTLAPGLGLVRTGIVAATGAMRGLSLATMANPIGLIIGGLALAAALVYKYWGPIKAYVQGIFQGIGDVVGPVLASMGQALAPLKPAWDAVSGAVSSVFHWVGKLLQPFQATQTQLDGISSAGRVFGEVLGGAFNVVIFPIRMAIKAISLLGTGIGTVVGMLVGGMRPAVDWLTEKFTWIINKWNTIKGVLGKVGAAIGSFFGGSAKAGRNAAAGVALGATVAGTAMAGTPPPRIPPPATAVARGAQTTYHDNRQTTIQVHAAPGMDEKKLGEQVRKQLDDRDRQQAARRQSKLGDLD